jgi:hypothetical protein
LIEPGAGELKVVSTVFKRGPIGHFMYARGWHLAETNGNAVGDEVEFILTSTHRDLAAQIGTVPELISRNLSSLQASGLIKIQGKRVTISKPQSLRQAADT